MSVVVGVRGWTVEGKEDEKNVGVIYLPGWLSVSPDLCGKTSLVPLKRSNGETLHEDAVLVRGPGPW